MALGRARDERKEQQWRRWIGEWRESGLSVRAFCARHHLATASFYAWRRVLERRAAEKPVFVPVQLVAGVILQQDRGNRAIRHRLTPGVGRGRCQSRAPGRAAPAGAQGPPG